MEPSSPVRSSPRAGVRPDPLSSPGQANPQSTAPPIGSSSPVGSPALYTDGGMDGSSPVPLGAPSSPTGGSQAMDHFTSSPLPYGSSANTPTHHTPTRGDIATPRNPRQLDLSTAPSSELGHHEFSTDIHGPTSEIGSQAGGLRNVVIWGTNVSVSDVQTKFKNFITAYTGEELSPKYVRLLDQIADTGKLFLNIDCRDLNDFDSDLYSQLLRYPMEMIPVFDLVVNEYLQSQGIELPSQLTTRPFNLDTTQSMRDLDPMDIDQLILISGMVIRTSAIIPDMKLGFFECMMCKFTTTVPIEAGYIAEPTQCQNCQGHKTFQLIHNRCKFADKQQIKLQETPEMIPDGATPQTVLAFAFDELVDNVQPGDRVEICGVYRATPLRVIARQRGVKAVFKTHIDVIHFNKTAGSRMRKDDGNDEENEDPLQKEADEQAIRNLAESTNVYERLTKALAPNIFGFDDVKKGVLLQLFGGAHKDFTESGRGRFRGEINVLLVGDPGTSKSQMLQYSVKLASRGIYTSGKGSSSVGLTAYVTKDPESKQLVLESGALVMCDGGVCCIDEFDKMSENTRTILHEAMEQQTVSIAKAGIICSLNARTSILAAANPKESRWNKSQSIVENVQLPPTLLSRFDLIYLILDNPDKVADRRLATHLVKLYYKDVESLQDPEINRVLLAKYISYARTHVHPTLSEQATRDLVTAYVEMRKLGGNKNTITATPRQLESLIRISEAHARCRLSEVVEASDVAEAVRLVKSALRDAATDPRTGQIDMDLLTTGQSMSTRSRIGDLAKAISGVLRGGTSYSVDALLEKLKEQSDILVTNSDVRAALDQMVHDEEIVLRGSGANPSIVVV